MALAAPAVRTLWQRWTLRLQRPRRLAAVYPSLHCANAQRDLLPCRCQRDALVLGPWQRRQWASALGVREPGWREWLRPQVTGAAIGTACGALVALGLPFAPHLATIRFEGSGIALSCTGLLVGWLAAIGYSLDLKPDAATAPVLRALERGAWVLVVPAVQRADVHDVARVLAGGEHHALHVLRATRQRLI
jgi:hypothetical protein